MSILLTGVDASLQKYVRGCVRLRYRACHRILESGLKHRLQEIDDRPLSGYAAMLVHEARHAVQLEALGPDFNEIDQLLRETLLMLEWPTDAWHSGAPARTRNRVFDAKAPFQAP